MVSGKKKILRIIVHLFILVFILLCFSLRWGIDTFGNVSFDEIIFHINMPLEGTSGDIIQGYVKNAVIPAALIWASIMVIVYLPVSRIFSLDISSSDGKKKLFSMQFLPLRLPLGIVSFALLLGFLGLAQLADRYFSFSDYVYSSFQNSKLIEQEYVSPEDVDIVFPDEKMNLICIYLESGESSAQDTANGGLFPQNYIPEMTELAKNNISFSQSDLIEGAAVTPGSNWTMGGLMGQTSALPLKLPQNYNNMMSHYDTFMPGITTLGDILKEEGYHNYFMAGSGFSFGGRENYFTHHGDYEILDLHWARAAGKIDPTYAQGWGFEDEKLYAFAKQMLGEIADKGEPFCFSMLTADTHTPNGYLCSLCRNDYPSQYANVWACASRQVSEFVSWVMDQPFGKNTVIYISGDHLSMEPSFYGFSRNEDYSGDGLRKVYNAFINSKVPVSAETEKNRQFTTLDMFPTILGAMGVQIEGNRLGLGTDLFSGEPTLSEKYGNAYYFAELKKKSSFYQEHFLYS